MMPKGARERTTRKMYWDMMDEKYMQLIVLLQTEIRVKDVNLQFLNK